MNGAASEPGRVELFVPMWFLVIGVSQTLLMVVGFRSKGLLAL